jgi:hypothetical protein
MKNNEIRQEETIGVPTYNIILDIFCLHIQEILRNNLEFCIHNMTRQKLKQQPSSEKRKKLKDHSEWLLSM